MTEKLLEESDKNFIRLKFMLSLEHGMDQIIKKLLQYIDPFSCFSHSLVSNLISKEGFYKTTLTKYPSPFETWTFDEYEYAARRGEDFLVFGFYPYEFYSNKKGHLIFMYASGNVAILVSKAINTTENIVYEGNSPVRPIIDLFKQIKTKLSHNPNKYKRNIYIDEHYYKNYEITVDSPNLEGIACIKSLKEHLKPYDLNLEFINLLDESLIYSLKRKGEFSYSQLDLPKPNTENGFEEYIERAKKGEEFLVIGLGEPKHSLKPFCFMYAYKDMAFIILEGLEILYNDLDIQNYQHRSKEYLISLFQNIFNLITSLSYRVEDVPPDADRLIFVHGYDYYNHFIEANL